MPTNVTGTTAAMRSPLPVTNHSCLAHRSPTAARMNARALLRTLFCLFVLPIFFASSTAQADPINRLAAYAGNINFTGTANTFRTQPDGTDPCAVAATSTAALNSIPVGATIRRAFLYWAASGYTPDNNVTLDGSNVTALRTYRENRNGSDRWYFEGVADITSAVNSKRNGNYTLSNLTIVNVNNNDPGNPNGNQNYCSISAVLGGFGILVIYDLASEPLRVINLYEGLQQFQGSSLTLTPNNFVIPNSPINGKMAVLSWEGDVGGANLNGFNENIRYNGNNLTTPINPLNDQYNSTVTYTNNTNSYGTDFDEYNISPYLAAGQTSGTAYYSSGQDLVLLGMKAVSVTSVPVSDMAISKTLVQDALYRGNVVNWQIQVTNNGPSDTLIPITVTDSIPAGLTYTGYTGTGWSCTAPPAVNITCTYSGTVNDLTSAPDLFLNTTVNIGATLGSTITNTATVSGGNTFDHISSNNSVSTSATVADTDLSTSAKTFIDLNGGDVSPGDVLRYRIDITSSNGGYANGIQVVDNLPANIGNYTLISIPAGSSSSFVPPPGGTNSTGQLTVTGINVAANSTESIEFDVTVDIGASAGTPIDNTATITPAAPLTIFNRTVNATVLGASLPQSGTKNLYIYPAGSATVTADGSTVAAANTISRRIPTATVSATVGEASSVTLLQTPVLQRALTLNATDIPVRACMARTGGNTNRTVTAALAYWNGSTFINIGAVANFPTFNSTTPAMYTATVSNASIVTIPAGGYLRLIVNNTSSGSGTRSISLATDNPNCDSGSSYSRVELPAATVINVDSVDAYTAPYAGGSIPPWVIQGTTVYARTVVSDPFGTFDIRDATLQLVDGGGGNIGAPAAMTRVAFNTSNGTSTYELAFTPSSYTQSPITMRVTAREGLENSISDLGLNSLIVRPLPPVLTTLKTSDVPNASPGQVVTYTVQITNTGTGNASNVLLTDLLPGFTHFGMNSYGVNVPFQFIEGGTPSTLTLGTPTWSNNNGSTWTYTLSSGSGGAPAGYDGPVTNFRLPMIGSMPPGSSFSVRYRLMLE